MAFCTRVWDSFLLDGYETLLRVAVAIIKLSEPTLLACQNMDEVMAHFKKPLEQLVDPEPVLAVAWKLRLTQVTLRKIRAL